MFSTSPTTRTARVRHVCTWCSQTIEPGTRYERWVTFDDSAFTSQIHPECRAPLSAECRANGGEYNPYDNERPAAEEVTHG